MVDPSTWNRERRLSWSEPSSVEPGKKKKKKTREEMLRLMEDKRVRKRGKRGRVERGGERERLNGKASVGGVRRKGLFVAEGRRTQECETTSRKDRHRVGSTREIGKRGGTPTPFLTSLKRNGSTTKRGADIW